MVEFALGRAVRKVIDETYLVDTFVQNSKHTQVVSYWLYLSIGYLSSSCERFARVSEAGSAHANTVAKRVESMSAQDISTSEVTMI